MKKEPETVIDNNEVTTRNESSKMCSLACDVVKEMCSLGNDDAYGDLCAFEKS